MRGRKYPDIVCSVGIVLSVLALCCLTPAAAKAAESKEKITLTLSHFFPANHYVNTEEIPAWIKAIKEATDDRVEITVYAGGTMLNGPESYDGVVNGIVDITAMVPGWAPGRFPAWEVFDLPGLPMNDAQSAAIITTRAVDQLKELQLTDTKFLWLHSTGPGGIYSKKPVRTPQDLKGMQVYATSVTADIAKALGASPVGGSRGEIYIMLQKGTIDGDISGPPEVLLGYKEAEVIKYVTLQAGQHGLPGFYNKTHFFVMNLDTWNSLPEDIQKAFNEVNEKFAATAGKIWDSHQQEGLDYAKKVGVEFIELTPEQAEEFVKPVLFLADKWAEDMESKGIPGKKILDTVRKICEDYYQ
ncbi:MAG: TRAP transporter substrate-binding protein [Desulfopila sp.]